MDEKYFLYDIEFEWDAEKAILNRQKHGISLQLASEVFFDPFLMPYDDEIVNGELRHTVMGMTVEWQVLYVVYIWRDAVIRLISARLATVPERRNYERGTT